MKLKLMAVCLMAFIISASAQDLKGFIKDKANSSVKKTGKKLEKEAGKEIDKETDKVVDKEIDKLKNKKSNNAASDSTSTETQNIESGNQENDNMLPIFDKGNPAKYENAYSFDGSFTMLMQSWDKKGKEEDPIEYVSYFSNDASNVAFEFIPADKKKNNNEKSLFIYDYKNKSMIIAGNDGESKSGLVMAIPEVDESELENEENETDNEDFKFTKTGKTKTILGYLCEEYYYKDNEEEVSMWITDKLPLDRKKLYGNLEGFSMASANTLSPNGFLMEMDSKNIDSQERSHMIVTSINPEKKTDISIKDYQLMNMGSTKMPGMK
ncbi:MAG: DUF4412 domain-containing protein [Bacteroidales bacterium]|nr:DUF4412 domain-containing protein [Bacteroidales bacterium]